MEKLISVKEKIKNINSLVSQLKNDSLSLIEKDIILQSIRELYIDVNSLETSEIQTDLIVEKNTEEQIKSTVVESPVVEEKIIKQVVVEEKKEIETVVEQTPIVTEPKKIEQKPTKEQQINLFDSTPKEADQQTIGEQLGQNKTSVYDRLSDNAAGDISHRISQKPISDIKSAIGIGDRFLYIRELFNGDNDIFEQTIIYLNALNSFDEAQSYLIEKFNWNISDETVATFINVVKRKFL